MNDRVNELINQATIACMNVDPAQAVPASNLRFNMIFAALIVQECSAFLNGAVEVYTQADQDVCDRAAIGLKNYFGVEL